MLNTLRRSFGMSPSSSNIQADMVGTGAVPAGVLSPSNKPNTFVPLRRSNSFTNFFSSSRPNSPTKDSFEPAASSARTSPAKQSASTPYDATHSDPVLAYLVYLDKKGRQKELFPIQNLKTTLGRSIENDVRFLKSDVSRHHCTIEIQIQAAAAGNVAFLEVIGANGVLLNGVLAYPAPRGTGRYPLSSGDSIVIAKRSFLFRLPDPAATDAARQHAGPFASPVKGGAQSAVPQTPAGPRRRVRMSLVNAAQIDTPARRQPASVAKAASPNKSRDTDNAERQARRANGLHRFMQSANVSPSKAKKSGRQSLSSSTSATGLFATPLKSRTAPIEPKTAPPKQVSFSLYANSHSGRLSPVKQMRMQPPLEAMSEELDGSFRSDSEPVESEHAQQDAQEEHNDNEIPCDESEEDIVVVEELEEELESASAPAQAEAEQTPAADDVPMEPVDATEDTENIPPAVTESDAESAASPSKSASPKRPKRRSSFFGRAGPFKGISLGFYAEERTQPTEPVESTSTEPDRPHSVAQEVEEGAERFSDASDVEPEAEPASPVQSSPTVRRAASKHMRLGISKTPSPVKKQHFVGLTPLPRRPRLSLSTKRRVSLRTQTLLRSSEAYSDRLFLPPPPPSPAGPGASGLSKSMSMPSSLSGMASIQPEGFEASTSFEDMHNAQAHEQDFESRLDPALVEEEEEPAQPWRDSDDDEDEVDQSLSVSSLSPQKQSPVYNFSPVKPSALPQFATPQPVAKTHTRRISMPPAGTSGAKPSARAALVRLQISGAGERIVHDKTRDAGPEPCSSPSKSRKVVRVSDVGLPATELSMGFDLVNDAAEVASDRIADALNDMFSAEDAELTDDEELDEDDELAQEQVVQISSRPQSSPVSAAAEPTASLPAVPQTPAALDSVRHLFSAASAAPTTPQMDGLAAMLSPSPEKTPQYGVLGERMRANPAIVQLLSPSKRSPKKAALAASPTKPRRGVRRSEAAEVMTPVPPVPTTPATPRAMSSVPASPMGTPLPTPFVEIPMTFEAELHVTMFDAAAMDAENEAIAQAYAETEAQAASESAEPVSDEAVKLPTAAVEAAGIEQEATPARPEPVVEETTPTVPVALENEDLVQAETAAPAEASTSKSRSRRAASASPTKPRGRSASPSKHATRSSPVKRSPAARSEELTKPAAEDDHAATAAAIFGKKDAEVEPEKHAGESPSKSTRRAGRKAKQAATEAISAALVAEAPAASPEKKTRPVRAKSSEAEAAAKPAEESESELSEEEEEEMPKRATRTRATRSTVTSTKPVRASRSRAAKPNEVPSSSAGYGDDEASDDEAAATATRGRRGAAAKPSSSPTKPAARSTRTRTTTTRPTRTATKAAPIEDSDESEEEEDEDEDEDEAPAPKTRTRAAPKSRATKTATTAASRSKTRAKDGEDAGASCSAATTRSGRPRRAAAANCDDKKRRGAGPDRSAIKRGASVPIPVAPAMWLIFNTPHSCTPALTSSLARFMPRSTRTIAIGLASSLVRLERCCHTYVLVLSRPELAMSQMKRVLIANRGEIACRLIRTYQLFPLDGSTPRIETVAVYTPSESNAVHVALADSAHQLAGEGPKAYLDAGALVAAAKQHGCWGIAPGYGFLSEDAHFSKLCHDNELMFLGPTEDQLRLLGNKVAARELASRLNIPVLRGTSAHTTSPLDDILAFAGSISPGGKVILKAANGGGGRGIRIVPVTADREAAKRAVAEAYESCTREAAASFGDGTVYAERFLANARHVEVQVLGDGSGSACHFWDRECSLQRRNQKLIEIAPAPRLSAGLRERIIDAALNLARGAKLRSLATVEFLVDPREEGFYFMEANPRIQVEHTITENVTGYDLVSLQLRIGLGQTLRDLGLSAQPVPFPTQVAIQLRVNAESFQGETDEVRPETGSITALNWPIGGGVRLETAAHAPHPSRGAYAVHPLFDSLLAKIIVTAPNYAAALGAARRALDATTIEGVRTNAAFLDALLAHEPVQKAEHHIHTVQTDFPALRRHAQRLEAATSAPGTKSHNAAARSEKENEEEVVGEGQVAVVSHLGGLVVKVCVGVGEVLSAGQEIVVIEAMKMEHVVRADASVAGGSVRSIAVQQGSVVSAADLLLVVDVDATSPRAADGASTSAVEVGEDPTVARPELVELQARRRAISDAGREQAVTKRHARGYRTVRENVSMLLDADSLIEYGDLALAAQRQRYNPAELIAKTSGDGIVTGFGRVRGHSVAVILGDYLVLAGTQGYMHHLKLDRILAAVLSHPVPVVLYAEGGGGRPGDTDYPTGSGLMTPSFAIMGQVRARGIPIVGVANGYVFAGNAALLGTCDLVIATRGDNSALTKTTGKTSIGMGGSAMIEAGGLGVFGSDEIGPTAVHTATGGVDVVVADEDAAAATARTLVGIFTHHQLGEREWRYSGDVLQLRTSLPSVEERRRAFDMRRVISLLVDDDSWIELGRHWGTGIITGLARVQGRAIAILANDPMSPLGGAIDIDAALKATRLLRLLARTRCTHLLSLCDTPGFMVGPEFERTAHGGGSFRVFGDWFTAAAEFTQAGGRTVGVVLRRAFGLGAQAMLGGSTLSNAVCAAWPAASLGPMSLEGAVKLSMKKQLAAIPDEAERKRVADEAVQKLYAGGSAVNVAAMAEIDTVLDPAETRDWIGGVVRDVLGERTPTFVVRRQQALNPHL